MSCLFSQCPHLSIILLSVFCDRVLKVSSLHISLVLLIEVYIPKGFLLPYNVANIFINSSSMLVIQEVPFSSAHYAGNLFRCAIHMSLCPHDDMSCFHHLILYDPLLWSLESCLSTMVFVHGLPSSLCTDMVDPNDRNREILYLYSYQCSLAFLSS